MNRTTPRLRRRASPRPSAAAGWHELLDLVLDADPLEDITNSRRISAVVLRGAAVDRAQPVR